MSSIIHPINGTLGPGCWDVHHAQGQNTHYRLLVYLIFATKAQLRGLNIDLRRDSSFASLCIIL